MALQTSGQISLNDVHIEAGGTTGTEVTMADVDVRSLIDVNQGDQVAMNAFYGASSYIELTGTLFTAGGTSTDGKINITTPDLVKFVGSSSPYTTGFDDMSDFDTVNYTEPTNKGFTLRDTISNTGSTLELCVCLSNDTNAGGIAFGYDSDFWDFADSGNYIEAYYNGTLIKTFSTQVNVDPTANSDQYWAPSTGRTAAWSDGIINGSSSHGRTTANLWKLRLYTG